MTVDVSEKFQDIAIERVRDVFRKSYQTNFLRFKNGNGKWVNMSFV